MATIDDIRTNISKIMPRLNMSASSVWNRLCEVFAYFIDICKLEIFRSEQIIAQRARQARITSRPYYVEKAMLYQEGDNLVVVDEASQMLGYVNVDPVKQIIKQASIAGLQENGSFILNVATSNEDGNIIPLNQTQLDSFRSYIQNWLGFGAQIGVASNEPAVWTATNLYIRYYRTYSLDYIKSAIYQALHDIQLLPKVNSRAYVNEIETYLTNLEGVRDAYFSDIVVTYSGNDIEPEDGRINLVPGYFNFDPALYDWTQEVTIFESV